MSPDPDSPHQHPLTRQQQSHQSVNNQSSHQPERQQFMNDRQSSPTSPPESSRDPLNVPIRHDNNESRHEEAQSRIKEFIRQRQQLSTERQLNLSDPLILSGALDSSIKKTGAFLRKLRSFSTGGESQYQSIIKDIAKLNMSRYNSEMVSAIAEAKLTRSADVAAAVEISSAIHRRYPSFCTDLEPQLVRIFDSCRQSSHLSVIDKEQAQRWRSALKLTTDLFRHGIFRTPKSVSIAIKLLMDADIGNDPHCTILSILSGFCRYAGYDFLGILPGKLESDFTLCDDQISPFVSYPALIEPELRDKCRALFNRYFDTLSTRLVQAMRDVTQQTRDNRRQEFYKGLIEEKNITALTAMTDKFDTLRVHLSQLSELLQRQLPDVVIVMDDKDEFGKVVDDDDNGDIPNSPLDSSLFDDEETHIFYTVFPSLAAKIPAVLLGEKSNMETLSESVIIDDTEVAGDSDVFDTAAPIHPSSPMDVFLAKLPEAMNREQIDELAESFCYLNNKGTRKRLIEAIYCVNRCRLDLLPYYSRLVAILSPLFPDIGSEVTRLLKNQFYGLMHHKTQHNIESKIRNVRFIGELVKFGIAHHSLAFNAWNFCLNEFSGQRIPVCCALLESCGRWLFRNPETNERCCQNLARMMKLKAAKYMDEHADNLVENAFYHCNPPAARQRPRKIRAPLHNYLRQLLYQELSEKSVDSVLERLRKLPWTDRDVRQYAMKCLFRADRVQMQNIKYLASIVSGLHKYHNEIAVEIADAVIEQIRSGLERNLYTESQSRLAFARYLAELYNYMLINAQTVFDTLYMILTVGHEIDQQGQLISRMDPPNDTFRARIVCVIIDGCGSYFSSGIKKRRLDRFLLFLQRYLILKTVVPADVDFMVADLIDTLSPRLPRFTTLADVERAIDRHGNLDRLELLNSAKPQANRSVSMNESDDDSHDDAVIDDAVPISDEDTNDVMNDERSEFERRDQSPSRIEEEKSFEAEFDRLVLESVEQRKHEKRTVQNLTDPSAFGLDTSSPNTSRSDHCDRVIFRMLTRKSNKTQTKQLSIPSAVGLASKTLHERRLAEDEQATLKRLVIAGMQRDQAEEQKRSQYGIAVEIDTQLDRDLSYRNYDPKPHPSSSQGRYRGRSGPSHRPS